MLVAILIFIFATTFLVAAAAVTTGSFLLGRGSVPGEVAGSPAHEQPLLLRQELLSTISVWHRLLARFDFAEILKMRAAEAGLRWSVGRVTLMMLLLGTMGAAARARLVRRAVRVTFISSVLSELVNFVRLGSAKS